MELEFVGDILLLRDFEDLDCYETKKSICECLIVKAFYDFIDMSRYQSS